jgi:hypothetical protein
MLGSPLSWRTCCETFICVGQSAKRCTVSSGYSAVSRSHEVGEGVVGEPLDIDAARNLVHDLSVALMLL